MSAMFFSYPNYTKIKYNFNSDAMHCKCSVTEFVNDKTLPDSSITGKNKLYLERAFI